MNHFTSLVKTLKQLSLYAVEFTLLCGGIFLLTAANFSSLPYIGG